MGGKERAEGGRPRDLWRPTDRGDPTGGVRIKYHRVCCN